jgi:DNA-binding response OmpR family regulator
MAIRQATLTYSEAAWRSVAAITHEAQGRKILVADADRTVLEMLQIRLDVAGYHTCVARNGHEVFELLKTIRPAGMVLDLGLPEIDGYEILESLSAHRDAPPFPTLVMGRRLGPDDVKRAAILGARDCMVKPFSGADALSRVTRMLNPKHAPTPPVLLS